MNILVIGAGMYVTGRQESGHGTILSSLAETSKTIPDLTVTVVATSPANDSVVAEAVARINTTICSCLKVYYRTISGVADTDIPVLCAENRFHAAIIAIPNHLHFAYTSALLKQRVHCLVVKPLTNTLADGLELERLRAEYDVYGAVEFHKRWDETNLWIKKVLDDRKLGKLLYFTVDYSQKITIPTMTFLEWSNRTNVFQYIGVHYVDLIWFLTGFIPIRTMAVGTDGILRQSGIDTWDSVHAIIVWQNPSDPEDRFVSQFTTNWIDPACTSAMSDQKYKVIGVRGRIECNQKDRGIELVHEELGIQQINPYFSDYLPDIDGTLNFQGYGHKSISRFIIDVSDLMSGRTSTEMLTSSRRPTLRDSLVSTAVIDCINQSLSDGSAWKDIHAPI